MYFNKCFALALLTGAFCNWGYCADEMTAKECSELQLKIRGYEETLKTAASEKVTADLENAQKKFNVHCEKLIREYQSSPSSCLYVVKNKNKAGQYEYDANDNVFNWYFDAKKMPPKEDREYIESLIFYSCVPEREKEDQIRAEEERLAQLELQKQQAEEKAARQAYFSQCPKGITKTSFDCYRLDEKFENHGFRGVRLKKGAEIGRSNCESYGCAYEREPQNVAFYGAHSKDAALTLIVVDEVIRGMNVFFYGDEETQDAVAQALQKKLFPNLKQGEKPFEEKNNYTLEIQGVTVYFTSSMLEKIVQAEQKAEEQEKKDAAIKYAEELF